MDIEPIILTVLSPALQEALFPIRVIWFIIFAFFACFIIWALFKTSWLKHHLLFALVEFLTLRPYGVKKMTKMWNKTVEKVETNDQAEYKPALVKIDETLDLILKRTGYKGKNLTERLDQLNEGSLPPLLRITEAHKICEEIIADPGYQLDLEEAKKMLAAYKEAFECLHAFN